MLRPFVPAAIAFLCAMPAFAMDLPARKPGLWDIKMSVDGRTMPAMAAQHCVDAETDKMMNAAGGAMSRSMCSKYDVQQAGPNIVVDSVCKMGPMTSTTKSVVTGSFDSAYSVKVSTASEGGPAPGRNEMTIEARWAGPCQSGQKPGDIMMGNGMKMNVRDLQKIQSLMPK